VTDVPPNIDRLDRDHRGYPIPAFVARIDGAPDFRVIETEYFRQALQRSLCWICGQRRSAKATFVIGPMCAINRVSAEPPSHHACAVYAAQQCPFLNDPARRRGPAHMPDGTTKPGGKSIDRNPGVCLLWTSRTYRPIPTPTGPVVRIGEPLGDVEWWCEGRPATRGEVEASIESGLPLLRDAAEAEGRAAQLHLARSIERAYRLLPAPAAT
jgi:hypothetical protein